MEHLNTLLSEINRLGKGGYDLEMLLLFEKVLKLARESNDVPLLCRTLNDYGGVLMNGIMVYFAALFQKGSE